MLSLLSAGDARQAATEVIRAHGPAVLRYLRALLRDEALADDAFSLFAEWAWSAIRRYRGDSPIRAWAFGIAWNAAQRVRGEGWQKRRERLPTSEASRLAQDIRTSSASKRERRADELEELRKELAPDEQNLLVLRLEQSLSWNEIAAILSGAGESVGAPALRKRFERLKDRLGELARRRGLLSRERPP
jgi:RNA polymerase sigma-70 factor (ECF subfamily)